MERGDDARCSGGDVLAELRHQLGLRPELGLTDVFGEFADGGGEGLGAVLDGDLGMRLEVVVPVGVRRRATLRREDVEVVTFDQCDERRLAQLPGLSADGVEDDERGVAELRGLAAVGAELRDDLGVPIVHGHGLSEDPCNHKYRRHPPSPGGVGETRRSKTNSYSR